MKPTKHLTLLFAALAAAVLPSLLVSSCISPESASATHVVSKTSSEEQNEDMQYDGEGEEAYRRGMDCLSRGAREEAAFWFRKGAELGHPDAQFRWGLCFAEGDGVKRDIAKACEWWRRAAENGNREAPLNLGLCMVNGFGVKRNLVEAERWLRRAYEKESSEWGADYAQIALRGVDILRRERTGDGDPEINLVRDCIAQTVYGVFPGILNVVPSLDPVVHCLGDFSDVLNDKTCDFYSEMGPDKDEWFGFRSVCEEIRLAGVDAPMLFVKTRSGSFGGTSIHILRRDPGSGMWRDLHGPLEQGNMSDIDVLPVTVHGTTRFLEPDMDYGPKLLRGFRVLDYHPDTDEFVVVASAKVRHSFELSPEDAKWIGREALEKMAFDDHEEDLGEQFFKWGDRTLHHRRFLSSSFHSSNGYYLHIEESGQTVWPREETGWDGQTKFVTGFLPVSRDGTNALVLLKQERSNNVLDAYRLSVLDIDSLQIIHTHVLFDQQILTTDDGFAGEPYSGVPSNPHYLGLAVHGSLYIGETKEDVVFNAAERERDHETPLYRNSLFLRQTSQGGVEEWRVLLTTGSEWRLGDGSGDWKKVLKLLEKAAARGHEGAKKVLRMLHEQSSGPVAYPAG